MMIARLTGLLDDVGLDGVLLDVGGVGYLIQVSSRTRAALPALGEPAALLIEMQVREDGTILYGFADRAERDWFRMLTTVQGVGGKVALSLLSVHEPDRLAQIILGQDKTALIRADGVGAKLAARLVTELKDRAASWGTAPAPRHHASALPGDAPPPPSSAGDDAVSALVRLGYRPPEAMSAVARAARQLGADADAAELIRAGLGQLGALKETAR